MATAWRSRTAFQNQQSDPAPKSKIEEEAATPGQPVRLRATGPPVTLTLGSVHRLPLVLLLSVRRLRKAHVFAAPTLGYFVAARNTKPLPFCAEPVDAATSLWKNEEI